MGNNLQDLREQSGWTIEETAERFGLSRGGYIKLERGERRLTSDYIAKASSVFGVARLEVMGGMSSVPVLGYVGAGAVVEPEYEQVPPEGLDTIELPFAIPEGIGALGVKGDSMIPVYRDGDAILVWLEQRLATESYVGEEAAVRTTDGRRLLKTILRGPKPHTYTLDSFNARAIEGVGLDWVGEIYLIVRASQLKRASRQQATLRSRRSNRRDALTKGMGSLNLGDGNS